MKKGFQISSSIIGVLVMSFSACDKKTCKARENNDCVCPQDFTPVCGCNGVTYSNACQAACVGVNVEYTGTCQ